MWLWGGGGSSPVLYYFLFWFRNRKSPTLLQFACMHIYIYRSLFRCDVQCWSCNWITTYLRMWFRHIWTLNFDANTCTFVMNINSTIYFGYWHRLQNAHIQYSCLCTNHRHLTLYIILITKIYTPYSYLKAHR